MPSSETMAGGALASSGRGTVTFGKKLGAGHRAGDSFVSAGAVELSTSSTITPSLTMQISEFFTSTGRIPRSTFWIFFLVLYGIMGAVVFVIERIGASETLQVVGGLLMLPLFLVAILVQIKRWHDRDKSGWWVLIGLVPCVGPFWALIECGFLKGTTGPNKYGPDPLQPGT